MDQDRRKLLKAMTATLLGLPFAGEAVAADAEHAGKTLQDLLKTGHVIGKIYLQDTPEEAHLNVLIQLIFPQLGSDPDNLPGKYDDAGLLRYLEVRTREDFGSGNLINIEGWRLARTEARICALSHLLAQS